MLNILLLNEVDFYIFEWKENWGIDEILQHRCEGSPVY